MLLWSKGLNAFLAINDNCSLLAHWLMYFGSLSCKLYGPRSNCSLRIVGESVDDAYLSAFLAINDSCILLAHLLIYFGSQC